MLLRSILSCLVWLFNWLVFDCCSVYLGLWFAVFWCLVVIVSCCFGLVLVLMFCLLDRLLIG